MDIHCFEFYLLVLFTKEEVITLLYPLAPRPPPCKGSKYGCCQDRDIHADGPNKKGCAGKSFEEYKLNSRQKLSQIERQIDTTDRKTFCVLPNSFHLHCDS